MKFFTTAFILLLGSTVYSQLPKTDLYMVTLMNNGERISIKDPVYLSGFNADGYNNQPSFISPSEVYITTDFYNKEFTDFVKLDLQNEVYYRITATDSISEYSPTPKAPNDHFSAVRVEKDGVTQTLWMYPNDHSNSGKILFENIDNIGYHCWLSETDVALFLVTEPQYTFAIGNISDGKVSRIMENIGRCFRQKTNGDLLFVHKVSDEYWYIKSYDVEEGKATIITQTRPNSEDFELLVDGTIIMAEGSKLFSINPLTQEYWQEIADLAEYDIFSISRLAASRNRLILVENVNE